MHWKTLEIKARQRQVPAFQGGKRWRFPAQFAEFVAGAWNKVEIQPITPR
jgi:hypothetical protein